MKSADDIKLVAVAVMVSVPAYLLATSATLSLVASLGQYAGLEKRVLLPVMAIAVLLAHLGLLYKLGHFVGRRASSGSLKYSAIAGMVLGSAYAVPFCLFSRYRFLPSIEQVSFWYVLSVIVWTALWLAPSMLGGWRGSQRA